MLANFWTYLLYGNRFIGIEHTIKDGEEIICGTQLKQSKKELNSELSFEEKTIEDVSSKLSKHQHLVLIINNEHVLSKTIESEEQEGLKLVYKAFPNINIKDFYFEVLSQQNKHFIALCRKTYVNGLIDSYSKQKLSIIDMSLGNSLMGSVSNFIREDIITSSNAEIHLENNQIVQIEKKITKPKKYDINGLIVSSNYLLSFCGALYSVLKHNVTCTNFSIEKERLQDDFKQTRFFDHFLKLGGLFILGMLLINFIIFNHYFNRVGELEQISQINLSTKNQIIELNESVSKKQKMVDDLLKSNGSKSSFYSNTIIQSLPNTILLSEFNYQPLLRRIKSDKAIELEQNVISISGTSSDSSDFSKWLSQLEQEDFVTKVDINDFGNTSTNVSDFKIKIVLEDD